MLPRLRYSVQALGLPTLAFIVFLVRRLSLFCFARCAVWAGMRIHLTGVQRSRNG